MNSWKLVCLALLTASSCVASETDKESWKSQPAENTETVAFQDNQNTEAENASVYKVKFETTKGDFVVEVHPEWAPKGAAQFKEAVEDGVYDGARFFRNVKGFMVQFGIPGDPAKAATWRAKRIKDDAVKQSNTRGMVTFAMAGPNTRTTQVFISFGDNSFLDRQNFSPFGKVVEGMDVVDALNNEYGETPDQGRIQQEGESYLSKSFPRLDQIKSATILTE